MVKVAVIGTGGHAKVVIDILNEMHEVEIVGITSKELEKDSEYCGYKVLGDDNVLDGYLKNGLIDKLAMGIGGFKNNDLRAKIFSDFKTKGFDFFNVIHPHSIISKTAKLGEGCVIFPGVVLNTDVEIGDNVIIITSSSVDHETKIGNHSLLSAGTTIGANTVIGENTLIALGAKVISGVTVGKNVLVAAGAVVVNDISDYSTVFGIPAKSKKQ